MSIFYNAKQNRSDQLSLQRLLNKYFYRQHPSRIFQREDLFTPSEHTLFLYFLYFADKSSFMRNVHQRNVGNKRIDRLPKIW